MKPKYIILLAIVLNLPMAMADDFKKTWDNAANRRIVISTLHGNIKFLGYDGKDIEITAVKNGPDRDRVEIQDASDGNQIHISTKYLESARNNATVDFEIRVPKENFYNATPIQKPQPQIGRGAIPPFPKFPVDRSAPPVKPPTRTPDNTAVPSTETTAASSKAEARPSTETTSAPSEAAVPSTETTSAPSKAEAPALEAKPPNSKTKVPYPKTFPPPVMVPYQMEGTQSPHAIYLKSNSGQITISDVSGSIRVETGSRNIEIQNVEGTINAVSNSGDIKGVLKQTTYHRSEFQFSSTSGDISVQAPDDVSALVYIQSSTGRVKTDFPLETKDLRYAGKFIQGKLGTGNQRLTLRSVSGAINFSKKPSEKSEKR